MVTDRLFRGLRKLIRTEDTPANAADQAGIDEKTAREYHGGGPSKGHPRRCSSHRTTSRGGSVPLGELGETVRRAAERALGTGRGSPAAPHRPPTAAVKADPDPEHFAQRYQALMAHFSCEVEKPEPLPETGKGIGVDVGLLRLATLSNGEPVEDPRWYRKVLRELRVLQRKVSRAVRGGTNRRKLVRRLQRSLAKVANSRKDFLNKFAAVLVARFDQIVLEGLRVAAMSCGRFALSILDAGWSYLVARLTHKAESAGREVALVDPASTSKTCSGCGEIFEHLSLSDRWISCDCGTSLDRDHNAAINILRRGRGRPLGAQLLAGGVCPEATLL